MHTHWQYTTVCIWEPFPEQNSNFENIGPALKAVRLAQLFECLKLKKIKNSKNKNTNSNLSLFTLVYIASEEHERADHRQSSLAMPERAVVSKRAGQQTTAITAIACHEPVLRR
jgi:hypothetical protein